MPVTPRPTIGTAATVTGLAVVLLLLTVDVFSSAPFAAQPPLQSAPAALQAAVLPDEGVELPITWAGLGVKLLEHGVIDEAKFVALYERRGGLDPETRKLLYERDSARIRMTSRNSAALLNLLWALGLGNKNPVLETGPMMDPRFRGAGRFASTGGWTLSKGEAIEHYAAHALVSLTPEQQARLARVAGSVYRPCCGNSTHFPDCNHGMAMLALLELLAAQGVSEEEMYRVALAVNSYWFPEMYLTIARYLEKQGMKWQDADPKVVLGAQFSSASGYQRIRATIEPPQRGGGGTCGVQAPEGTAR